MARDGSNIYNLPFPPVVAGTTISSGVYNGFTSDMALEQNNPRPILSGGTGAASADVALFNLSAAKAAQLVTNYDAQVWMPGTFYSATTATGEPVDGHAFSGIAYIGEVLTNPPANLNVTLEARDVTDGKLYIRRKVAGSWGSWTLDGDLSGVNAAIALKVDRAGDTMTGPLVLPAAAPTLGTHATNKAYVDGLDTTQKTYIDSLVNTYVRYDIAQSLTVNQMARARANIDVTKKNYIVNGAMMISQEFGTTGTSANNGYPVDQFGITYSNAGSIGALQTTTSTPSGSPNRLRVGVLSTDTSVGAGDYLTIFQFIEGYRVADLRSGSVTAKTVTLQFGVKAPAGTYCVSIRNGAVNRSYVAEYVISAGEANTDVVKSVVIPLDTGGTWTTDNSIGLIVSWTLMSGTTGTANTWTGANIIATTNQFNFMGQTALAFELFDVGLYEGSVAPPFIVPDYGSELAACQRYFFIESGGATIYVENTSLGAGTNTAAAMFRYPATMRITPVIIPPTWALQGVGTPVVVGSSPGGCSFQATSSNALGTRMYFQNTTAIKFNARL